MSKIRNEGEGSRTAARAYNTATRHFVESGKVEAAAKDAEQAIAGPEGPALREAERLGKRHSHGEDPKLSRNPAEGKK